jgi:hypothetical protein
MGGRDGCAFRESLVWCAGAQDGLRDIEEASCIRPALCRVFARMIYEVVGLGVFLESRISGLNAAFIVNKEKSNFDRRSK